ncbi:MAG: ribosome small subunit-dependent GTPase A [Acidimicrobiales bacterium]
MSEEAFLPLVPYGWSDRVLALWRDIEAPGLRPARIARVDRGSCVVVTDEGRETRMGIAEPVAVGDWVATRGSVICAIVPRWSAIERQDPSETGTQVLAANVDVVLVATPADRANAARVERELVLAWDGGGQPVVVVTKVDLGAQDVADQLRGRLVGADVVATSARDGVGIDEIRSRLLPCRTAVLLGPSGVGKSTLVNALLGACAQDTGDVRHTDGRGRHTTTARQLLALPGGGVVIDTPGLRSLGLAGAANVDGAFPEIEELSLRCRFRDCAHGDEPGCAVTEAVQAGLLQPARVTSYRKLVREVEREVRRQDPVARKRALEAWKAVERDVRRNDKRRRG